MKLYRSKQLYSIVPYPVTSQDIIDLENLLFPDMIRWHDTQMLVYSTDLRDYVNFNKNEVLVVETHLGKIVSIIDKGLVDILFEEVIEDPKLQPKLINE